MHDLISFDDAMKMTGNSERALLIGNGFSIRHFSYQTLLEQSGLDSKGPLRCLFDALDTVDFEVVIRTLEGAALVEKTYKKEKRAALFQSDADKLRRALVHAVRWIHPAYREDIQEVIPQCAKFLSSFKSIFTLNYDLLLYWVCLEDTQKFADGFGLGEERGGFRGPFKSEAHCNVYNLHGGLHLFKTSSDEVEKRLTAGNGIIDAISETITTDKRLPLYVAEGSSAAKLARIYSVPYLRHCYETLKAASGNVFIYGHSANANDAHIYDALFDGNVQHLYFCIHRPTARLEEIDGELSRYQKRRKSKINYTFVDSETAKVWG